MLNKLKGALRSGDIWVKGSRRYRNFDDYLIPSDDFEKSHLNNQLPLAIPTDCNEYIESRIPLDSRLLLPAAALYHQDANNSNRT